MLHDILKSLNFRQSYTDSCFYNQEDIKGYTDSCSYIQEDIKGKTLVGIYVDDLLATGTSVKKVDEFFNGMKVVELKDLGAVAKFLGIVFDYDVESGWELDQECVIEEMLEKFGLSK
uniref:Reverse transcriptase Ty1/copia-type domain-containing protein n=1 Tax=Peronospora matthiolae TaxID=2874970 RepID=A0AAV1VME2_9STRA